MASCPQGGLGRPDDGDALDRADPTDFGRGSRNMRKRASHEQDELLTAEEVVAFLKLPSVQTMYYWNTRGTGPKALKVGKHLRYWLSDVLLWLDEQQQAS